MKKLILIIPILALVACGESEEEKESKLRQEIRTNIDRGMDSIDEIEKALADSAILEAQHMADSLKKEMN